MRITINGAPLLPPNMGEGVRRTLGDIDRIYVDGHLVESHTLQFFGVHPNHDIQSAYDSFMQDQISRESATAAMHVKAFFVNHVFDLHNLGQHLHGLMGMTS